MNLKKALVGVTMMFTAATANAENACADQSFIDTRALAKTLVESKPESWNGAFLQGLSADSKTKLGNDLVIIIATQTSSAKAALTRIDNTKKREKPSVDIEKLYKRLPEDVRKILSDYQASDTPDKFATTAALDARASKMTTSLVEAMAASQGAKQDTGVLCPIKP